MSTDYSALGFTDLVVSFENSVVTLVINREKDRNTFGGTLVEELIQVLGLCDRDDRVRVVILTAHPKAPAYCSGADISGGWSLVNEQDEKDGFSSHRDGGGRVAMAVYNCRKITIAAVNGHAAGVGTTALQLPFDFRYAWQGAKLVIPFVRRGIVPEATSTYLLPRLIGHSRATALLLAGMTVNPKHPLVDGLYHETFANREDVYPAALEFAKDLAANTTQVAVAFTKGLLHHSGDSVEENHLFDSRAFGFLSNSNDASEGAKAFVERRKPIFTDTLSANSGPGFYPWWKPLDTAPRRSKL